MSKQDMVDLVPSENDVEYMFDTFADNVEEYIKSDKIKKFNEQLTYLHRDITTKFSDIYSVMEAMIPSQITLKNISNQTRLKI